MNSSSSSFFFSDNKQNNIPSIPILNHTSLPRHSSTPQTLCKFSICYLFTKRADAGTFIVSEKRNLLSVTMILRAIPTYIHNQNKRHRPSTPEIAM